MLLNELLVKYREACSMSQSMFVDELSSITSGKLSPSVGVLNGVEHGSAITDELLSDYLNNRFLSLNIPKNRKIVDISYKIATYCSNESIELDLIRLLGFVSFYDVMDYLFDKVPSILDELTEYEVSFIYTLSRNVDVNINMDSFEAFNMNDSAFFCYNLCLWFFLHSYNKDCEVPKEVYSDPKFVGVAELYGFNQFSKTSTKAKAKIARTIAKRISLYNHLDNLIEKTQYITYIKEAIDSGYLDSLKSNDTNNYCAPYDIDTLDALLSSTKKLISLDNNLKDIDFQEIKFLVKKTSSLHNIFLSLYAFHQGFGVPSKSYLNMIISSFEIKDDRLKSIIEKYVSEYNEIYDTKQFDNFVRLVEIQMAIFKLCKFTYLINSEINHL